MTTIILGFAAIGIAASAIGALLLLDRLTDAACRRLRREIRR